VSTLRVMTFNIHGTYNWERRITLNVAAIKRATPDLIGFQELQAENLAVYKQQLPKYDYDLGPGTDDEEEYVYNAIFWKPKRLTRMASGGFWLSETPDSPSLGWDALTLRTAQWAQFRIVETGKELVHCNTHLDHRIERARVEGVKLILQRLAQLHSNDLPVILTGDFNCNPDTAAYRLLLENGFVDAYRFTGHADKEYVQTDKGDSEFSNTVHAYGWTKASSSGAKITGSMRFDWLMFRDHTEQLHPVGCEIMRDAQPPLYPSDHYPVVAEFAL